MISEEETRRIKAQMIEQVKSIFPEGNREDAIQHIESMDSNELEKFLQRNNLAKSGSEHESKCIFCSIVFGEIESHKIGENKDAIAVLEINPVSRGHTLIIPKKHISSAREIPKSVFSFSGKISKKLEKLNPKEIKAINSSMFGHEIINLIPVYSNENINSKRSRAPEEELEKLQKILEEKRKKIPARKPKAENISEEKLWIPKRTP